MEVSRINVGTRVRGLGLEIASHGLRVGLGRAGGRRQDRVIFYGL